ncbi:acyl carrier protein [Eubacteriales bacterium OttesenSCG-928-G02]|nr:acyl carrier protein [Eubacteriales bacterium OttesenSCG-928-G02]
MTEEKIFEGLNKIFRSVFDDKSITVTRKTTADDIDDWDSLEHINLIGAVERFFKMKFSMKEVSSMKNVGEMADIISQRCK